MIWSEKLSQANQLKVTGSRQAKILSAILFYSSELYFNIGNNFNQFDMFKGRPVFNEHKQRK